MALSLTIDQDLSKATAWTKAVQKQLPFATSAALNAVAGGSAKIPGSKASNIREALKGASRGYFDQPTKFIQNAWRQTYAKKRDLKVTIYAADKQVPYLKAHLTGGRRTYKGYEAKLLGITNQGTQYLVPAAVKRNNAGNVTRATLRKITANAAATGPGSVLVGRPLGGNRPLGVYERTKRGKLKPLFVTTPSTQYKAGFPLENTASTVMQRRFNAYFGSALQNALRTAKV